MSRQPLTVERIARDATDEIRRVAAVEVDAVTHVVSLRRLGIEMEIAHACRRAIAADRRATREAIRDALGDYSPSCMELALACVGRRRR